MDEDFLDEVAQYIENNEKPKLHLYRGINDDLTIGSGKFIRTAEDLKEAGAKIVDLKTNRKRLITEADLPFVRGEMQKVRDYKKDGETPSADAFKDVAQLYLDEDVAERLMREHITADAQRLASSDVIDYESLPKDTKLVLLDMVYANGVNAVLGGEFPSFIRAINNRDWVTAAYQSRFGGMTPSGFKYNIERFADNFAKLVGVADEDASDHFRNYFLWKNEGEIPSYIKTEYVNFDSPTGYRTLPPKGMWDKMEFSERVQKWLERFQEGQEQHRMSLEQASDSQPGEELVYSQLGSENRLVSKPIDKVKGFRSDALQDFLGNISNAEEGNSTPSASPQQTPTPTSRFTGIQNPHTGAWEAQADRESEAGLSKQEMADAAELFGLSLGLGMGRYPKEDDGNPDDRGFLVNGKVVRPFAFTADEQVVLLPDGAEGKAPVEAALEGFKQKKKEFEEILSRLTVREVPAGTRAGAPSVAGDSRLRGNDVEGGASSLSDLVNEGAQQGVLQRAPGGASKTPAAGPAPRGAPAQPQSKFNPFELDVDVEKISPAAAQDEAERTFGKRGDRAVRTVMLDPEHPFYGRVMRNRRKMYQRGSQLQNA